MGLLDMFKRKTSIRTEKGTSMPSADELFELGKACHTQDPQKGFQYFLRAAEMGNRNAMNRVGLCYLYKYQGASFDIERSAYWFERGAQEAEKVGDAQCMLKIAMCYMSGVGVKQNDDIARTWLQKAVKNGHEAARKYLENYEQQKIAVTIIMKGAVETNGIPPKGNGQL